MATVGMGEINVSTRPSDELVARGLGSCIGLALVDRAAGVAGLAHIVLPETAADKHGPAGRFADQAVPELIAQMRRAGAHPDRLEAVIAGGARMFELGAELDIGARNETAVRALLERCGVILGAAATGGRNGRTLRVAVGEGKITVKEVGGTTTILGGPGAAAATMATTRPAGSAADRSNR
jgi:chemotaxis protein CheD